VTGRALVFGGGGVTGVAWELGMLAGLADAGVELSEPDLVVGTSAGAVVGALVASGADLNKRYDDQLATVSGEIAARMGTGLLLRYGWTMLRSRDPRRFRTRMGKLAMAAPTVSESERRRVIDDRLALDEWPQRRLLVVAVDAQTGEFAAFDRNSGVPLTDAVAASCAVPGVWPPVTINGRRWIDGGMRSAANADLAAGHERVVVLAPVLAGGGHVPSVTAQVSRLRQGSRVELVVPDAAARAAIGRNVLDPARRAAAARAGRAQAAAVAARVAEVWN
jgi:NTE family protein